MSGSHDEVAVALENAIRAVEADRGSAYGAAIRPLIQASHRACRVSRVLRYGDTATPADYVARVVRHYDAEHERVSRLLHEQDPAEWERLHDFARKHAWAYLRSRLHFRPVHRLQEDIECVVGETLISVLKGDYFFDVGFEQWAVVVVLNQARKLIDRTIKPRNNEIEVAGYDEWLQNLEQVRDSPANLPELRRDLSDAIQRLSSGLRQEVIRLRYFEGLTPADIAARLDRTPSSIYKAHYDALKELRGLLPHHRPRRRP